jgi:hypothetical protein
MLAAALFLVRVPFLNNLLVGEEGCFSFLVANPTRSSALTPQQTPQCLIGNVGGSLEFAPFERTIIPYEIVENGIGSIIRPLHVLEINDHDTRTRAVRLGFLALFGAGVAGAVWLASRAGVLPAGVLVYGLTTPLAVGASIQPQIDGSVGVLLVGLAAWLLVSSQRPAATFTAGLLVGLGRHEWALAFFGAAVIVLGLGVIWRSTTRKTTLPVVLGLGAGVIISLIVSYEDYLNGFTVMKRVTGTVSPLVLAMNYSWYLIPTAILLVLGAVIVLAHLDYFVSKKPGTVLVLLAGGAILAGFALSGWPGDGFPRYYAPALVLVVYALVGIVQAVDLPSRGKQLAVVALVFGVAVNAYYLSSAAQREVSITSAPGLDLRYLREQYRETAQHAADGSILPLEHAGFWLYYPNVPFFSRDMGVPGSIAYLKNRYPDWVNKLKEK